MITKSQLEAIKHQSKFLRPSTLEEGMGTFRPGIKQLYEHEEQVIRVFATILNGTYSKGSPFFLFSFSLMKTALGKDKLSEEGLDQEEYSELFSWLVRTKMVTVLRGSCVGSDGKHKANLIELTWQHSDDFEHLLPKPLAQVREDYIREWDESGVVQK